jgi:hypothetical protein
MSVTEDPFNYRSLNRSDLMLLSTIKDSDNKFRKFKGGLMTKRDYSYNLHNQDIFGN